MIHNSSESPTQKEQLQPEETRPQHIQSLRFVFGKAPSTKQLAFNASIHNAVHYTPLHDQIYTDQIYDGQGLSHHLTCQRCGSYFAKHCQVMQTKKIWVCCICKQHNSMTDRIDMKGLAKNDTYDIIRQSQPESQSKIQAKSKLYLLVIDLCVSQKQLQAVKNSILQFIKFKSMETYQDVNLINRIGIITYNKYVYCYELANSLNTVICVSAEHAYENQQILKFLGVKESKNKDILDRYFLNARTGRQKLEKRIKKIKAVGSVQNEDIPVARCRSKRSYGQAINIAISMCENIQTDMECRVITFIGGPCTYGVGTTIGTDFRQQMRSIIEVENGENINNFHSSISFYNSLRKKIQARKTILDLFIFSIEQTGLTQMYNLARSSGGLLVLGQQFSGQLRIFQKSFQKAFIQTQDNQMIHSMSSSAFVSVTCSSDIKINGALGCCKTIQSAKGKQYISEKPIGFGDTNVWYLGGLNCYKTITFMYELSSTKAFDSSYCIQFKTLYKDYFGQRKIRITTVRRQFSSDTHQITANFDQQAAIMALARWYLYRAEFQPKYNLRQWIDKILVRWTTNFASFIKGDIQSFSLPQKVKSLPHFVYFFRRNQIVRKSALSFDQFTYHTHTINNQTVQNCIKIIQPGLLSYCVEKPQASPVPLQQQQMKNSVILLLDTHFHVILWYGQNIQYWQKQQFHKQKEYQHIKYLLDAPEQDIKFLLGNRFPFPGFYKTSTGHSKERLLKSKISPSTVDTQNQNMLTDDKSLKAFMKALIHIVVNNKAPQ